MPFLSISLSWSYSAEKIINTGAAETRLALIGNLRTVVDEADVIQGINIGNSTPNRLNPF